MLRLFCLFVLAFVAIVSKTGACRHSAARHPGAFISNDVESLPELFAVKHPKFSRAFCPKAKPNRSCKVIEVNFQALEAPKMKFLLATGWPSTEQNVTLKKTSEEGLDLVLKAKNSNATATITYKYKNRSVAFVLQQRSLYGSLDDAKYGRFSIKPCPLATDCHVLIQKRA